ncbi:hypothetical protein D3C83_78640 [compost metagenome]
MPVDLLTKRTDVGSSDSRTGQQGRGTLRRFLRIIFGINAVPATLLADVLA